MHARNEKRSFSDNIVWLHDLNLENDGGGGSKGGSGKGGSGKSGSTKRRWTTSRRVLREIEVGHFRKIDLVHCRKN
jgi:hypothetical protein